MKIDPEGAANLLHVSGYNLGCFRVLELSGDCDIATEPVLRNALMDVMAAPADAVIVDMTHVGFCDGASAAWILAAGQVHRLVVSGVGIGALRIFDFLDPDQQVHRYPSVDLAAWSLAGLP